MYAGLEHAQKGSRGFVHARFSEQGVSAILGITCAMQGAPCCAMHSSGICLVLGFEIHPGFVNCITEEG